MISPGGRGLDIGVGNAGYVDTGLGPQECCVGLYPYIANHEIGIRIAYCDTCRPVSCDIPAFYDEAVRCRSVATRNSVLLRKASIPIDHYGCVNLGRWRRGPRRIECQ